MICSSRTATSWIRRADSTTSATVAISGGRIAEVASAIPSEGAARVDAVGAIVTPGLIDSHPHLFRGADYFGIDADSFAWRSGVTTWLDAGSAGAFRMPAFREHVIDRTAVTVRALINTSWGWRDSIPTSIATRLRATWSSSNGSSVPAAR